MTWRNVDRAPDQRARQAAMSCTNAWIASGPARWARRRTTTAACPTCGSTTRRRTRSTLGAASSRHGSAAASCTRRMESHLAKYRSLVPSLALLCHLADVGTGPVGIVALERALAWAEYLESHARRIYDAVIRSDLCAARALGERIRQGQLASPFGIRDVYRQGWAGLSTRAAAAAAVAVLVDLDWLRAEDVGAGPAGGRPTARYHINPKLAASRERARTAQEPASDLRTAQGEALTKPTKPGSVSFVSTSLGGLQNLRRHPRPRRRTLRTLPDVRRPPVPPSAGGPWACSGCHPPRTAYGRLGALLPARRRSIRSCRRCRSRRTSSRPSSSCRTRAPPPSANAGAAPSPRR